MGCGCSENAPRKQGGYPDRGSPPGSAPGPDFAQNTGGLEGVWMVGGQGRDTRGPVGTDSGVSVGPCEVCGYARGDWTPRVTRYCPACRAWICDRCWNDWPARIVAAARRKLLHGY